jgi:hypothetical protein
VLFKNSVEAKKRPEINKANANLKIYHHVMSPGGYKSNRHKWEKVEKELIKKEINPETGWERTDEGVVLRGWGNVGSRNRALYLYKIKYQKTC